MKILIAGGGQTASLVAGRLIREGNEVVMVEQDAERCRKLEESLDAKIVQGSAASIGALRKAGIDEAEMLIALTSVDQINILFCLVASVESKAKVRVARLRTHEVDNWRRIFQQAQIPIDLIIHPETDIAERVLRVLHVPGVSDILDFADGRVKLFATNLDEGNRLANKRIEEIDTSKLRSHGLIAMIFRGHQAIIPHGGEILRPGDTIYFMSLADDLDAAYNFLGLKTQESLERVFILGGKQLGIEIAQQLEQKGVSVKLFEKNAERCELISRILKKTVVIHADGTEEAVLTEENIEGVGAFLSLTGHDEDNIMASLLARKLKAKKVVALINRLNYLPMVQRLGIATSVSPRLTAVDRILRFVRKGRVISVTSFREEEAESIELIAAHGSKVVGKPLKDLHLPRECIIGAISRPDGEVIVPRGEDSIQPGDRVILFALEKTVAKLQSVFLAERRS
ncbi:MAG: Trk system potassium transporter TrkA [Acidobacteria bacterium]|nr:Trk system potassium transporter TrkA [Acidobacteriota bacterium]